MPARHASSGAVGAPAASARAAVRLSVLLPLPLAGVYDYLAPRALALEPGDFVVVPLGSRQLLGVAWGDATGDVAAAKLKAVIERLPAPPMREELRRLIDWVASYTLAPAGAESFRGAAGSGRRPRRQGGARRLQRHRARRRHRLGQDRDLFRGDRRDARARQAGAGAAAGDRLERAVPVPLLRPFRRAAGAMAFRSRPRRAARHLARCRRTPCHGGGWRALRAVPSLRRSLPHRRRRGARRPVLAGGRRPVLTSLP